MKHALLAVAAVAALAFPALAATATHATAAKPVRTKLNRPVHQMLGALAPYISTGLSQGHVLKGRSPRPQAVIHPAIGDPPEPNNLDNLTFGGPDQIPPKALSTLPRVMNYNVNYAIYWVPDGYRMASNYQSVIDQYFNDVAAESGNNGSTDSPAVQYFGNSNDGPIFYDSTFGGSAVDRNPYPKATCSKSMSDISALSDTQTDPNALDAHIHALGETTCLSDTQIQAEVKKFADSQGWPHGPNTEFFIYTGHNVGSCFYADGKVPDPQHPGMFLSNVHNPCAYDYYCAYHSEFGTSTNTEYIYANMAWPNQAYAFHAASGNTLPYKKSDCDAYGEHPNGTGSVNNGTDPQGATDLDAGDEAVNVTSHEHNESVTDPTGYGWFDDTPDSPFIGYENGDLCAWSWVGAPYGEVTDNNSYFTNVLNGDPYFMQGEWSNANATVDGFSGCAWGHTIDTPVPSDAAVLSSDSGEATPAPGNTLTMTGADYPAGTALEFEWIRCKPDVSIRALKAHALSHSAQRFSTDPCSIVQDDFSADNSAPADNYAVTAKDVHMDVIALLLGWNGTDPSVDVSDIMVGGEPANAGGDSSPTISPTSALLPGTTLHGNVGTWSGTPTSFTGSWQRCTSDSLDSCKTFKTATLRPTLAVPSPSTTYILTTADIKFGINFVVTAKNALGTSDPDSAGITDAVGGVPTVGEADSAPSWVGEIDVGSPDTLNFGLWGVPTGAPVTGYSGVIRRCPVVDSETADLTSCEGATPFTATAATHSVNYTPVTSDDQYFLVAFLTAKNKNGTSFVAPVIAGIVGGHPTLTDPPTVTEDSSPAAPDDTVHLHVGTWTGNPDNYLLVVYECLDPNDVTTCSEIETDRVYSPATSMNFVAPDYSPDVTDYYLRFDVFATNSTGFSNDAWSNAGEVLSTS